MISQRDKAELANYFYPINGGGESSTAGFSTFQTTFTSGVPTTITSGSTYVSLASTSTNPLQGNESDQFICTTASGSIGSGWITDPIALNNADLGKLMQLGFDYLFTTGGSGVSVTGLDASQTLQVWVYNVTTSTWVQPSGYNSISSNGATPARTPGITFTSSTTSGVQYRIAWIIRNAPSSAFTMQIDCISFGRQVDSHGPLVMQGAVSGAVTVQATAVTTSYPLTLPSAQGATSSFLINDGTGKLNWSSTPGFVASPTVTKFSTAGSFIYTVPTNCLFIEIEMVAGGGGGAGGDTASSTSHNGNAGGTTSFGTSFLTCTGGAGGQTPSPSAGGVGGTATINGSGAYGIASNGVQGGGGFLSIQGTFPLGGYGASTPLGGGAAPQANNNGASAIAGSGAGGSGGGLSVSGNNTGGAGGAGAYIHAIIPGPSGTYPVVVGAGGVAGTPGTSGFSGGNGGSGVVICTEYYYIPAGSNLPSPKPATFTALTSGSGLYTTPSGCFYLEIEMVGGGGGGSGGSDNGAANAGSGTSGAYTTFGTSLLTAFGGNPGTGPGQGGPGTGTGGIVNGPAYGISITGGNGNEGQQVTTSNYGYPGPGGVSTLSVNGNGGNGGVAYNAGQGNSGGGGGAGGYVRAFITTPSATYPFSVGVGGNGGSAGSGGGGGSGGYTGIILITEHYYVPVGTPYLPTPISCRYISSVAQSVPNGSTVINFATLDHDTGSNVTTGSNWLWTCKVAGVYAVSAGVSLTTGAWSANAQIQGLLLKNGTAAGVLGFTTVGTATQTDYFGVYGSDTMNLNVGDTLQYQLSHNDSTNSHTLLASVGYNHISIYKVD